MLKTTEHKPGLSLEPTAESTASPMLTNASPQTSRAGRNVHFCFLKAPINWLLLFQPKHSHICRVIQIYDALLASFTDMVGGTASCVCNSVPKLLVERRITFVSDYPQHLLQHT